MTKDLVSGKDSLEEHALRWRAWLGQAFEIDEPPDDSEDGEEGFDEIALVCHVAAALQRGVDRALHETDHKITKIGAALNGRTSVLQQRIRELEAERERQAKEADAMRARILQLEAETKAANVKLTETTKAIADLGLTQARDRSYVRMVNERRYAPIAETSALEAARRRTDAIIRGELT